MNKLVYQRIFLVCYGFIISIFLDYFLLMAEYYFQKLIQIFSQTDFRYMGAFGNIRANKIDGSPLYEDSIFVKKLSNVPI